MADLYRIRDWAKHFENNRTKELKRMAWVPMPTKHDGDGYTQLLDHQSGLAHFGAWCLIVEVAAKCDPRGTLLRDGQIPHDATSLARITRAPVRYFKSVLPRLVSIGWIEVCEISQEGAVIPQVPAQKEKEQEGTELQEKEQHKKAASQVGVVLAHYKTFHPRARPGEKERDIVRARLKDGYSVADLKAAIDGNHRSAWHSGENDRARKFHDLDLILRTSGHVLKFMEVPENGKVTADLGWEPEGGWPEASR